MLRWEAANTNFIVFGVARSGLKSTIYHTLGEHGSYYTTDVVYWKSLYTTTLSQTFFYSNNLHTGGNEKAQWKVGGIITIYITQY